MTKSSSPYLSRDGILSSLGCHETLPLPFLLRFDPLSHLYYLVVIILSIRRPGHSPAEPPNASKLGFRKHIQTHPSVRCSPFTHQP